MSQSGQFLCINSVGDYYEVPGRSIVFNMESEEFRVFDFPVTYNCSYGGKFYAIGSSFSYLTNTYEFSIHTIQ